MKLEVTTQEDQKKLNKFKEQKSDSPLCKNLEQMSTWGSCPSNSIPCIIALPSLIISPFKMICLFFFFALGKRLVQWLGSPCGRQKPLVSTPLKLISDFG